MSDRRLLYYDSRHQMYCYEPPIRLEEARAPVDEAAAVGVDTFVLQFGVGTTVFHLTEVGEIWGTRLETFEDQGASLASLGYWRAYENIMSLKERGIDLLTLMIDRAHEKGMEFFGSLRMNHPSDPKNVSYADNWQFRIDHPEWCLRGDESDPRRRNNFNWVHPEVRAERFALIEEVINKYDMDGFEVDWTHAPYYFEAEEVEQNRHILTEYMRDVRRAVEKVAQDRGKPMTLGARVFPALSSNLATGIDILTWLEEGLLDYVVPMIYGPLQMDADYPFEWLLEPAHASGCEVYPALQSRVESQGFRPATIDQYRAAAAAYWLKGADALYLPAFDWPLTIERLRDLSAIGHEVRDPDFLAEKPKHYVVTHNDASAESYGYPGQLPLTLTPSLDAPDQIVRLYAADDPERAYASLRLRILNTTSHDSITVSLNGSPLQEETCRRTLHSFTYYWLEYPLPRGALRRGRNEVGIALRSRPPNLAGRVVLDNVELLVSHSRPVAP